VHNQVETKAVPQEVYYRQEQTEEHAQNEEVGFGGVPTLFHWMWLFIGDDGPG